MVLPAAWRREHLRGRRVLLRTRGNVLEIIPKDRLDLMAYFDAADVDVKSDLAEWHLLRKVLEKR